MKSHIKNISICIMVAGLAILTACNKKLDVVPGKQITPDQIQSESDVIALLSGSYANMQDANAFGERYLLIPDLLADEGEMNFGGSFLIYNQIQLKVQTKTNVIPEGMWKRGFFVINNANLVLSKIDLISKNKQAAIVGEAKFIRAITSFMLSGFFGKPYSAGNITANLTVPLMLQPVASSEDLPAALAARATVDVMFKQLEADLTDAAGSLPEDNGIRANKYAAYAVLSRVYLAEGKYEAAAKAADAVISSDHFGLTTTFKAAFNNATNSSEDVFAIQQTDQSNAGTTNAGLGTFYSTNGRGDITIDTSKLGNYEKNDVRKSFFYKGDGVTVSGFYTSKWELQSRNIPVVRLAEMYLTRAEGNLRAGTVIGDDPVNDINAVRGRSNASILVAVTADIAVQERIRELAFEGDKFFTYKRLKMDFGTRKYDDNKLILPIPQRETDVNSKLTQNDGY